jgi:hypothetical protein
VQIRVRIANGVGVSCGGDVGIRREVIDLLEEMLESDKMDQGLVTCIFSLFAQLQRERLYPGGPGECACLLGDDGGA